MADGALLLDLALVTAVAAVTTLLFHRLRQPVVVGYLLAGVLVGPAGPLAFASVESVQTLAELGIVFLMFSLGLEFRIRRLARAGLPALGAALVGILAVFAATLLAARALGWGTTDGLFLGAILAISSTVIAAKAILERGQETQRWAELALAVLIVQDLVAIAILAVLGAGGAGVGILEVLGTLGRLATFAMAALVLGLLFVPRLVTHLARGRDHEILVVTLAGLALGTAALAVLLGFSPALGAFLMGAVVAEAGEAWTAEQRVRPLRDLFTAVFFVSIGMLLDPAVVATYWRAALALGLLMVLVKVAAHTVPAFLLGERPRDAFKASLAVAQIGEFSFVIAALGLTLGATSDFVLPVTVALAMGSALWTPYLVRSADAVHDALAPRLPATLRERAVAFTAWRRRRAEAPVRVPPEARRLLSRMAFNGLAVVLILLATNALSASIAQEVTVRGLTDHALALLPWLLGGVLALPFGFKAARSGWLLASGAWRGTRPAWSVQRTFTLVLGSAAILFLAFLAAAPVLPPLPLLLLSLAAFLGAAIVLWESMTLLHAKVEDALENALGTATGEDRRMVLDALREEVRWGAEVASEIVEPGTTAAHATVRELALRSQAGATLVAVRRAGRTIVNPPASFVLEPGDALVLLAEANQLERARALLRGPVGPRAAPEARIAQVLVQEGSPLAGRTLAESALRERTGATIVGILRGSARVPSPGAETRVEPGDVLLVVGAEEEVRGAEALARGPGARAAAGSAEAGPNV